MSDDEHGGGHDADGGEGGHDGGRGGGHDDEHGGDHEGGEHSEHGEGHGGGPVGGIAGGTSDVLGGVADLLGEGEDTKDAREALETASDVAEGVQKGAETAEDLMKAGNALQSGNLGGAAGGLGDALGNAGAGVGALTGAVGNMVPQEVRQGFQEASRVANTVGQVARGVGQIVEGATELLSGLLEQRQPVHFALEIAGQDSHITVRDVHLTEALGQLYEGRIDAIFSLDDHMDERDLLSKDVTLTIERGDERRHFRGIVRHASVRRAHDHHILHVDIAPALWLAAETLDSRIYQDLSVPDLVEQVVGELLGSRHRTVKRELTEDYEPHEYLVQHRESHFGFLSRLMREEGIFFYFDHDEDDTQHEVLVMADSNSNRPLVRPAHDGLIEYDADENRREGRELAFQVHREHRVGATDAVVRGFDWTNPGLDVRHEQTDRGEWHGPRLEIYDHHHAVRHHGYDDGGGSYQSHTADRRTRMHTERLDLARSRYAVATTVVSAQPGHLFELQGADTEDGRYVIVSMSSSGSAGDHGGQYTNWLDVIPSDQPYRPPEPERPVMPGPETAIVVGPPGEEIHTDRHGRIKVQFHWDRQGQRNEHSSAWIRVTQSWAGPGWGFVFIPRIGMEVIVSFLGGDPDRPIVTGCVYNGTNPPPYALPDEKTKSTIKTNSSLGGGGSNELRFEDKAGSEEVYIHAQKDFNEVVENNHSTHVKNCQTNTVDVDQTETIGRDQEQLVKRDQSITVKQHRKKTVAGNEEIIIGPDSGNRTEWVHGDEAVTVNKTRRHDIRLDDTVDVYGGGSRYVFVRDGNHETTVKKDSLLTVESGNRKIEVQSGSHQTKCTGRFAIEQNSMNQLVVDDQIYGLAYGPIQLKSADVTRFQSDIDGKMLLSAATEIVLQCQGSSIRITPSGVEISAPTVTIGATSGDTTVTAAGVVKLKP